MKKYFFSFFVFFFAFCCLGVSFAEENLMISQTTAIRAGKLTFQLPSGFQKDNVMYKI